jgi:hypothetical protein
MLKCSACNEIKDFEEFSRNKSRRYGRNCVCKKCINENESYKEKKSKYNKSAKGQTSYFKSHLKKKFQMTIEQKLQMFNNQNGLCEMCDRPFKDLKSACVDHNHETGQKRGLLCKPCNTFLGIIKEDSTKIKTYIEKYKSQL